MTSKELFDYIVSPILVAGVIGGTAAFMSVLRTIHRHDTALAVLIEQVNPPGGKSLRELLNDLQLEMVRTQAQAKVTVLPVQTTPHPEA